MNLTRIKKLIPRLSALLFLLAAILLLIYSAPVRKGVSAGLESCAAVLIPSLFPFMVLPAFWAKAGQQTAYREYWDRW